MCSFSSWNLKLDAIIYQVLGSDKITSPKSYSTLRRKFSIFNIPFPCLKEKKKLHLTFHKSWGKDSSSFRWPFYIWNKLLHWKKSYIVKTDSYVWDKSMTCLPFLQIWNKSEVDVLLILWFYDAHSFWGNLLKCCCPLPEGCLSTTLPESILP